jgi:demethylmenaquinone methyltransferase/2-methoxy-6-polyprenyl-1,4-benzoquinol methylase
MIDGPGQPSRVTRTRREAQAAYDRISRWYDWIEGGWETKTRRIGLQKLGACPGESVLEIGCGTGHGILALAQAISPNGRVHGLDLSARMLAITDERARRRGLSPRVSLCQADATHLPYASGSFDGIFMSFVLELFDTPEIPGVLYECRRVLRGGGRVVVVSLSKGGHAGGLRGLYEWGHRRFPALLDCRPIYVQDALVDSEFQIADPQIFWLWGLPAEVVLANKPFGTLDALQRGVPV